MSIYNRKRTFEFPIPTYKERLATDNKEKAEIPNRQFHKVFTQDDGNDISEMGVLEYPK